MEEVACGYREWGCRTILDGCTNEIMRVNR